MSRYTTAILTDGLLTFILDLDSPTRILARFFLIDSTIGTDICWQFHSQKDIFLTTGKSLGFTEMHVVE